MAEESQEEKTHKLIEEQKVSVEADLQRAHDDELVARYRHFQELAFRMIVGELEKPTPGHPVSLPQVR
jgi:hypothetical protein